MPSALTFAKYDIPYPIFEADFDPYNRGYLLVAGGGGENNTGVDNKITLLDTSNRSTVSKAAEIDLSKDEDSVQSLASLATKDGLVVYAGLNSGSADIKAGKNEHFRSFLVDFPIRKKPQELKDDEQPPQGRISLVGKTGFFAPPDPKSKTQTYQRLLKLSPALGWQKREAGGSKRVGAIATAWAKKNEIVLFDATDATPKAGNAFTRLETHEGAEAEDIDITEISDGKFSMAYCTDSTVLLYTWDYDFGKKKAKGLVKKPLAVYSAGVDKTGKKAKLRSLRWISPEHLLVMQNFPSGGAQLLVLQVEPGKISDDHIHDAYLTIRKQLPSSIKQAVNRGLDVCFLDADPGTGQRQIVVAVAGSDRSIHLFTLNYSPQAKAASQLISRFNDFDVLKDVHPNAIGKLTFTNFFPPKQADTAMSVATTTQYIQLASISVANTVVVDTLALTSTPTAPSNTTDVPGRRKNPSVRYVLSTPSTERIRSWTGHITLAFIILFVALFFQSGIDYGRAQGYATPLAGVVGAADSLVQYLPPQLQPARTWLDAWRPASTPTVAPVSIAVSDPDAVASVLADPDSDQILHFHAPAPESHFESDSPSDSASNPNSGSDSGSGSSSHTKSVKEAQLQAAVHASESTEALEQAGATKYEDLHPEAKKRWRDRLQKAGHWAESQGESVLLGVLFSEYAGVVGGAVRDAVLG